MAATIGGTTTYTTGSNTNIHNGTITIGSDPNRTVAVAILMEQATTVISSITIDGITATLRSGNPDTNPNDSLLRMFWYDADIPSGTGSGSKAINITSSTNITALSWYAWEIQGCQSGGPESGNVGHANSGANATCSVTATTGAALIAAGLAHAATATLSFSGDVTERAEQNETGFTTGYADAGNVASGTRSVTLTPSLSARNSVRLMSYAAYTAPSGPSAAAIRRYRKLCNLTK